MPEAAVYGVSSYYDDLTQPRGRRHVRVCTGTACWAADFDEHVDAVKHGLGLGLRRGLRRRRGVARRDRVPRVLPLQPGRARPRRRSTPGPDAWSACSPAAASPPPSPSGRARWIGRCCCARATSRGCRAPFARVPDRPGGRGQGGQPARARRGRLSRRDEVGVRPRRQGRATSSSSSTATRAIPAPTSTSI